LRAFYKIKINNPVEEKGT